MSPDEMISALKQKLEIMESFDCSSSSFDALNSFQVRRSSSVVVIAEDDQIPSPTFKSLKRLDFSLKSSKRDSKTYHRERSYTEESALYCSQIPLQSPDSDPFVRANRSASILPSIKHSKSKLREPSPLIFVLVFTIPFSARKDTNNPEVKSDGKRKLSFFKNLFTRKQIMTQSEQSSESICSIEKSDFESIDDFCPTFSYEEIISGKVPLHELDIEKIEVSQKI
jgi:hypothetical protein